MGRPLFAKGDFSIFSGADGLGRAIATRYPDLRIMSGTDP